MPKFFLEYLIQSSNLKTTRRQKLLEVEFGDGKFCTLEMQVICP
jgi:hypothetical protein